jgi:hypothetical protein
MPFEPVVAVVMIALNGRVLERVVRQPHDARLCNSTRSKSVRIFPL